MLAINMTLYMHTFTSSQTTPVTQIYLLVYTKLNAVITMSTQLTKLEDYQPCTYVLKLTTDMIVLLIKVHFDLKKVQYTH